MKLVSVTFFALVIALWSQAADPQKESSPTSPQPELISFPTAPQPFHGWLSKPPGPGPFPAVLFNHGSEKTPGSFPPLAACGHPKATSSSSRIAPATAARWEYIVDLQNQFREKENDAILCQKHDIELHERANADVVAAVAWLKEQPFIDKTG